jgi:electron transfer flavoprotein alpha subunit
LGEGDFSVEILERSLQTAEVGLSEADIVVAGGAGCGVTNWHLVEDLAAAIGGRVGASRAAVEAGLAPRSQQVGQTGSTVHPRLYVACGISGALQHVVGMKTSATVVAINRDASAPIFRFAHYGIVGDVAEVLPRLTQAFAAAH